MQAIEASAGNRHGESHSLLSGRKELIKSNILQRNYGVDLVELTRNKVRMRVVALNTSLRRVMYGVGVIYI